MSTYDILDQRFQALIIGHAKLDRLWTGSRWAEGPVYVPSAKSLLWSDIPNDRVLRFDETDGSVSVFESPCGYHNGHSRDAQGRVIACEHGGRRISRLEPDGRWVGLVERFDGKRFNSPNDVVVKSDGTIWFSDPTYGIDSEYEGHAGPSEIGASNVYRFDPASGALSAVVTDMVKPNGLTFSPDERLLYVAETGATHVPGLPAVIRAYDVAPSGLGVGEGRIFATSPAGFYDGFRVDRSGNIWTSTADAVAVYAPDGALIGRIPVPEIVSNLTFGGPKRNRLYITAQTSLYAIFVNAHGLS
ncbi:SMP-30/gluconolactonase/LRE family protein [Bradyrhizobium arachidis]|uniref:SMP-30/gluconolactonase/LRE family protein n=1 Tax=Bradyrhizobium TaxID=374 RepID=UPI0021614571|nr:MULTISPECIES: SMP-30/gluconolactonase/LRE family protein [Bradyrhizobium]MDN4986031.1 SMP-30/gluconolactonase/LRE family protein [Bradyrhizobium sp. WYCCWR 13022]UVO37203.1 SMP-30/gluconolactonase/LRE family protein [Bradyrhizobium arachidis]